MTRFHGWKPALKVHINVDIPLNLALRWYLFVIAVLIYYMSQNTSHTFHVKNHLSNVIISDLFQIVSALNE